MMVKTKKGNSVSGNNDRKGPKEPRWLGPVAPSRVALIPPISAARWLLVLPASISSMDSWFRFSPPS
jgi:hypothetical protein